MQPRSTPELIQHLVSGSAVLAPDNVLVIQAGRILLSELPCWEQESPDIQLMVLLHLVPFRTSIRAFMTGETPKV